MDCLLRKNRQQEYLYLLCSVGPHPRPLRPIYISGGSHPPPFFLVALPVSLDHSCPPSSLVSPKRGFGAGVGVGMLRVRGNRLVENKKVAWLLGCWFLVCWFLGFGFLVSRILVLKDSWFLGFKDSKPF